MAEQPLEPLRTQLLASNENIILVNRHVENNYKAMATAIRKLMVRKSVSRVRLNHFAWKHVKEIVSIIVR